MAAMIAKQHRPNRDFNGFGQMNRLVKETIQNVAQQDKHGYDALGRRITSGNSANTIPDLYYSSQWQVLEERSGSTVKDQYVWSIAYVDAMVLRDRDAASGGDLGKTGSGLDERLYAQQDANYNVTALVDTSGAVVERFIYDPYGSVTVLDASWAVKNDGAVADSDYNWVYLHQGGRYDDAGFGGLYIFDHRNYSPSLGRWAEPDPATYIDSPNVYQALLDSPVSMTDPTGLAGWLSPGAWFYYELPNDIANHIVGPYIAPSDDTATGDDILIEFFNSVGPTTRHFGQKSFMTAVIRDARAVKSARSIAHTQLKAGNTKPVPVVQSGTAEPLDVTWMLWNRYSNGAQGNMGFIGSYRGSITFTVLKSTPTCTIYNLHFNLNNTTSSRSGGGSGPANRPVKQIWNWDETYSVPRKAPLPPFLPLMPDPYFDLPHMFGG